MYPLDSYKTLSCPMITCVFVLVQKLTVNVLLYNSGGDCLHQNEKKKITMWKDSKIQYNNL